MYESHLPMHRWAANARTIRTAHPPRRLKPTYAPLPLYPLLLFLPTPT